MNPAPPVIEQRDVVPSRHDGVIAFACLETGLVIGARSGQINPTGGSAGGRTGRRHAPPCRSRHPRLVATVDAVGALMTALRSRGAHVGILGMGYVGLPAALSAARAGFTVTGFDVDEAKVGALAARRKLFQSHSRARCHGRPPGRALRGDGDFERLPACDAILICVPTPLDAASRAGPVRS